MMAMLGAAVATGSARLVAVAAGEPTTPPKVPSNFGRVCGGKHQPGSQAGKPATGTMEPKVR